MDNDKSKDPHHGKLGFGKPSEGNPILKGHKGPSMLSTGMRMTSPEEFSKRLKAPRALDFKEIFAPEEQSDTETLAKLRTCLSVCISAGESVSATELRSMVQACGMTLEEV